MAVPEELERQRLPIRRTAVFDLSIMRSWERAEPGE
jgi:hypothetical protein